MTECRGSSEVHERTVERALILLGKEAYQIGRFFRNETGAAYRDTKGGKRIWFHYGIKGSPDIYGILAGGRYIGIEIKTGNAVQQENQKLFQRMIESFGGLYKVCKSEHEALEFALLAAANCK